MNFLSFILCCATATGLTLALTKPIKVEEGYKPNGVFTNFGELTTDATIEDLTFVLDLAELRQELLDLRQLVQTVLEKSKTT